MLVPVLAFGLALSPQVGPQQVVHLRIVNGSTGKRFTGAKVTITTSRNNEWRQVQAEPDGDGYVVRLDGDTSVGLGNVTKSSGAWNQYRLCATGANLNPIYTVSKVLATGLASPNDCNRNVSVPAKPGEVVFYVHLLPLWQRLRNSIGN